MVCSQWIQVLYLIGCHLCNKSICEISFILNIGPFVPVKGTLTASTYQDILDNFLLPNFWNSLGMSPSCFPKWLCTSIQSKVHKDVDEHVWCGGTWLACTESWQQPDRTPLEWRAVTFLLHCTSLCQLNCRGMLLIIIQNLLSAAPQHRRNSSVLQLHSNATYQGWGAQKKKIKKLK